MLDRANPLSQARRARSDPSARRPTPSPRRCGAGACAARPAGFAASAQAASVGLGTTSSFSVLGGTTVTGTGPTVMSGDLGVSPGTAITGFPPGTVLGTVHGNDGVAQKAQGDLTTAYNSAAGAPSNRTISADLAGLTLVARRLHVSQLARPERRAHARRPRRSDGGVHLPSRYHADHRLGQPRAPARRRPGLQRVLAGRQLGDDRNVDELQRKHPGPEPRSRSPTAPPCREGRWPATEPSRSTTTKSPRRRAPPPAA